MVFLQTRICIMWIAQEETLSPDSYCVSASLIYTKTTIVIASLIVLNKHTKIFPFQFNTNDLPELYAINDAHTCHCRPNETKDKKCSNEFKLNVLVAEGWPFSVKR